MTIRLPFDTIRGRLAQIFTSLGFTPDRANLAARLFAEASLDGVPSHGLNRVKPIYYDRIKAGILDTTTRFEIVRETPTTAVVDGHVKKINVCTKCMKAGKIKRA